MQAPTLHTDRLILAPLEARRFAEHFVNVSDTRVTQWIGTGQPQSRIEAWRRFCQGAGLWALLGYGYWGVIDRANDRMVGMAGLADFKRGMAELGGYPEAGWAFSADVWGRGVASETVAAILEWADHELRAPEVRCIIAPGNTASIRVAQKNGFVEIGRNEGELGVSLVFARQAAVAAPTGPTPAGSSRE